MIRLTDHLDMTIDVDWGVKQTKSIKSGQTSILNAIGSMCVNGYAVGQNV